MVEAVLDIKQWGNNLGVRLPAAVAREAHLHDDEQARVLMERDRVGITPFTDSRLTLEQRLAADDPKRNGGEQKATTQTSENVVGAV